MRNKHCDRLVRDDDNCVSMIISFFSFFFFFVLNPLRGFVNKTTNVQNDYRSILPTTGVDFDDTYAIRLTFVNATFESGELFGCPNVLDRQQQYYRHKQYNRIDINVTVFIIHEARFGLLVFTRP